MLLLNTHDRACRNRVGLEYLPWSSQDFGGCEPKRPDEGVHVCEYALEGLSPAVVEGHAAMQAQRWERL